MREYGTFYEKLPPQPSRKPRYGKDGYELDPVLLSQWDEQRAEWVQNDGSTRCAACKHEHWVHDGPSQLTRSGWITDSFCRWRRCACTEFVLTQEEADLALVALMLGA